MACPSKNKSTREIVALSVPVAVRTGALVPGRFSLMYYRLTPARGVSKDHPCNLGQEVWRSAEISEIRL